MAAGIIAKLGGMILGGGAEGIGKGAAVLLNAADEYFYTKEEKAAWAITKEKLLLEQQNWQAKINLQEAGHRSLFVAGWRPAIGWICAATLAWSWIVGPMAKMVLEVFQIVVQLPVLDTGSAISLVLALLGMGTLRTLEKASGVSK